MPKSILVVDDERHICVYYEAILSRDGFAITSCPNGEEALKLLREDSPRKFDLLILDLMMPICDGLEVIAKLRAGGYQNPHIFVITAKALDQEKIRQMEKELNVRVWKKPLDHWEIRRSIHSTLKTEPPGCKPNPDF